MRFGATHREFKSPRLRAHRRAPSQLRRGPRLCARPRSTGRGRGAATTGLLVLDAERGAEGANIVGSEDALWWAATTVTTVGYGDRFPVTGEGRLVAVALMVGGIALLGVVTASVAAWFVQRFTALEDTDDVSARLARIEALLEGRSGLSSPGDASPSRPA